VAQVGFKRGVKRLGKDNEAFKLEELTKLCCPFFLLLVPMMLFKIAERSVRHRSWVSRGRKC